jgi:hypothetical protein
VSGQTTALTAPAGAVEAPAAARSGRRFRRRHLWLVPGLAIAVFANELGGRNGVGIPALIAFGIAPDLPRLFGASGRLAHNVLHRPALALAAVVIAAVATTVTTILPVAALVGALVWLGHVVIGWAVGDVPRPRSSPGRA